MSDQTKSLNLANAVSIINDHIQKTSSITPEEQQFLEQIKARIRAIHVAQRGYTKAGLIEKARYFNHPLTQKDLIDEALINQKKSIGFTWITVSQLLQNLTQRKANSVNTNFNELLMTLEKNFNAVLDNIKDHIQFKPNSSEIEKIELANTQYKTVEVMSQIIESFGGRFLPFFQGDDPLAGKEQNGEDVSKSEGNCAGYVRSWSKEISLKGYASSLQRLNEEVSELQNKNDFHTPTWRCDYYAETDFRQLLDQMLNAMRSDKTYCLEIFPSSPRAFGSGHDIGIRYLPSFPAYEMMDPNLGIVVFEDRNKFINFLADYLIGIYFDVLVNGGSTVTSDLRLYAEDVQPMNAKPSIPNFTSSITHQNQNQEKLWHTLKEFANSKQIQIKDREYLGRYWGEIQAYGLMGFNLGGLLSVNIIGAIASVGSLLRIVTYLSGGALGVVAGVGIGMKSNFARELFEKSGRYLTQKLMSFFLKSTVEIKIGESFTSAQKTPAQFDTTTNLLLELGYGSVKVEVIQMCDASSRNIPDIFKTILCNCLSHGFRKFDELKEFYPDHCIRVIELIAKVYDNDDRTHEMSKLERLHYHQTYSKHIMRNLHDYLENLLLSKQVEPNDSLGKAVKYMLKHWHALTQFLRVEGAPLDNNIVERALKIPIRGRRTWLFYKTEYGAMIGGVLTSIIYSCALSGINPLHYLIALQENKSQVVKEPEKWLPWNYKDNLFSPIATAA